MRTITINNLSFAWKLRAKDAKKLGVKGPGHKLTFGEALTRFGDDWDAAKELVLAGVTEDQRAVVDAAVDEWSVDDYPQFIQQAFGTADPNPPVSAAQ